MHLQGNVVVTGADQVTRDLGVRKFERRATGLTVGTASTTAMSSTGSSASTSPEAEIPSISKMPKTISETDELVRAITREMVQSLMRENPAAIDNDDISIESGGSMGSRLNLNLDIDAIAEAVMKSVSLQMEPRGDQEMHKVLRVGLADSERQASQEDLTAPSTESEETMTAYSKRSTRSNSTSGSSRLSDLSNVTGGQEAPMDIWHPGFWADKEEGFESSTYGGSTLLSRETSTGHDSCDSEAEVHKEKERAHEKSVGSSIHDFLKNLNNEIHSSDSEDEDDVSVLSDITGLTGCFEDYAEGRRPKKDSASAIDLQSAVHSATTLSSAQKKAKAKRAVSYSVNFASVSVRQYERIMCDNPASTAGPSIGIGWNYVEKKPLPVDEYHERRKSAPRRPNEMLLNRAKREKMLRALGYSESDMAACVRHLNKLRAQRRQTVNNLGAQKVEEAVESAKRQVKRLLFMKQKDIVVPEKPQMEPQIPERIEL